MKTRKITSLVAAILLSVSFLTVSCQDKKSASASSEAKAPAIDIHTAVLTENKEALKQHIAAGTNLNEKDPFGGSSPLITAAVFGKPEMAKMLIDAGADINFQNNEGSTALLTSAFFCRPEIVTMLLKKGADKAIKNKYGVTAYQTVASPFSDSKAVYEMMEKALSPMGLKLDYAYIEKTRPEIAAQLK